LSAITGIDEVLRRVEAERIRGVRIRGVADQEEDVASIFVGIDWGSEQHQVCAIDKRRKMLLETAFEHSGSALERLTETLLRMAGNDVRQLVVAIEVPRGPIVETLLEKGIAVFSINPKQLDRFRDRHSVAGAKDDRRDALVLADSLRTDRAAFRRARLGEPWLVELRELTRLQEELKAERIALGNRLHEQLHRYFPQLLELDSVYEGKWLWELLEMAPTPELAQKLSVSKLRSLLKRNRIRRWNAEQVKEVLGARALRVAPGVAEATSRRVALLIPRLRLVHEQKVQVERDIERLLEKHAAPAEGKAEHRDALLLQSLPGLGTLVCATMLAEAWEPLQRRDYRSLRTLSGVAPVTKRSGKQYAVQMRSGCNRRLRTAVHYWAGNAIKHDAHWKDRYAVLRAAGHSHGRALRGVGDRLLATLVAVLNTQTPYDASRRGIAGPAAATA
jgi:transposase